MTIPHTFPAPPGTGISIGPIDIRAYGLLIAIGAIAAVWLLGRRLEAAGKGTRDDAASIGTWGVVGGLVGARLYHVATEWDRFADNLSAIPQVWKGGLGIPGGLLLGAAVGAWRARSRGVPVAAVLTAAAPAIPLAQAIGRWGNWFNQELFGRATTVPWALEVDAAHTPATYELGTTFHPTFLYESVWSLGLCGLLLWIDRTRPLGGSRLFALYVAGYGVGRFWVEGLRIDAASTLGGLRWNQWVALAAVVGGLAHLVLTRGGTSHAEPVETVADVAESGGEPDEGETTQR